MADCAVTLRDFVGDAGEAMAMASARRSLFPNAPHRRAWRWRKPSPTRCPARIHAIGDIKLSANWMAAVDVAWRRCRAFDAVHAVGMELLPGPRHCHPGRQRLMSMRTSPGDGSCKSPCTRRCR